MSNTKRGIGSGKSSVEKDVEFQISQRLLAAMSPEEKRDLMAKKTAATMFKRERQHFPSLSKEERQEFLKQEQKLIDDFGKAKAQAEEQYGSKSAKTKKKRQVARPQTLDTQVYQIGLEYLNDPASPFVVEFDPVNGMFEKHQVYKKVKPLLIKGITNHPDFRLLIPLSTQDDLDNLMQYIREFPNWLKSAKPEMFAMDGFKNTVVEEWEVLANPSNVVRNDPDNPPPIILKRSAANLKVLYKVNEKRLRTIPFQSRRLFRSEDYMTRSKCPKSYVPPTESFPEAIQSLSFEDIFPIFPEHECALFKLWLGRVGVGPSNQIPDGWDGALTHTFRLGIFILGREAGVGKSYQMDCIRDAMYRVGMSFESMRTTSERFGTGRFTSADVAYKDDSSKQSSAKIAASDITKQIISQGEIVVEDKYKDQIPVIPRCAIAINANEIDMNEVYNLDPGIIDRVKILKTRDRQELAKLLEEMYPDPTDRPEALEPAIYFLWLAKHYNISVECLMLWAMRQATDMFYRMIKDGNVRLLYRYHHFHSNRLRLTFLPNIRISVMKAMILSMIITNSASANEVVPEFSPRVLNQALLSFARLQGGKVNLSELIKADWEEANRDPKHPWQGFRDMSLPSIGEAIAAFDTSFSSHAYASKKAVEAMNEVIAHLHTRGGQKLNGGYTHLAEDWNEARSHYGRLAKSAKRYKQALPPEALEYLHAAGETDLAWTESADYSPDTAEYIRPTMWP